MRTLKTVLLIATAFLLGVAGTVVFFLGEQGHEADAAAAAEIILYSHPNFEGRRLHIYGDCFDLPFEELADGTVHLWNDNIGSIVVVSGTWRLYQHGRCNTALDDTALEELDLATKDCIFGWSNVLSGTSHGPLRIASLEDAGLDVDISSVQLVSGRNLPDWLYGGE